MIPVPLKLVSRVLLDLFSCLTVELSAFTLHLAIQRQRASLHAHNEFMMVEQEHDCDAHANAASEMAGGPKQAPPPAELRKTVGMFYIAVEKQQHFCCVKRGRACRPLSADILVSPVATTSYTPTVRRDHLHKHASNANLFSLRVLASWRSQASCANSIPVVNLEPINQCLSPDKPANVASHFANVPTQRRSGSVCA